MGETLILCVAIGGGFYGWLRFVERRDIRRFEQRTEFLKLRATSTKSGDVEELKQRVSRLELKGLSR